MLNDLLLDQLKLSFVVDVYSLLLHYFLLPDLERLHLYDCCLQLSDFVDSLSMVDISDDLFSL